MGIFWCADRGQPTELNLFKSREPLCGCRTFMILLDPKACVCLKVDLQGKIVACHAFFNQRDLKPWIGRSVKDLLVANETKPFLKQLHQLSHSPKPRQMVLQFREFGNLVTSITPVTNKSPVRYFFINAIAPVNLGAVISNTQVDSTQAGLLAQVETTLIQSSAKCPLSEVLALVAHSVHADAASLSVLDRNGHTHADTYLYHAQSDRNEKINLDMTQAPFSALLDGEFDQVNDHLNAMYPNNALIRATKSKALLGFRLYHQSGQCLGLFCLYFDDAKTDLDRVKTELSVIALRITSELERRITEQHIKASEKYLTTLVKNIPDTIVKISPQGQIEYINHVNGPTSRQAMIGTSVYDYMDEAEATMYQRSVNEVCQHKTLLSLSVRMKDDTQWYVRLAPVEDNGQVVALIVIASDLTEKLKAEEESKKHKELHALAQRAANIGSWEWNIKFNRSVWSDTLEPMFGLNYGEFDGTFESFIDLVFIEDRQSVVDALKTALKNKASCCFEYRVLWPNNELRWLSSTAKVTLDEMGEARSMIGITQDITRQKQHEQALRESETKWRTLVESAPDFITLIDRGGTINYVNRVLPGLDKNQVLGTSIFDYSPKEFHPTMKKAIDRVFEEGVMVSYSTLGQSEAGVERHYVSRLAPIRFTDHVHLAIMFISDITGKVMTETELEHSQKRFQFLVESSFDGYWDWPNANLDHMWWSPRLYELLEYSNDEIPSTMSHFQNLLHPNDRERVVIRLRTKLLGGERFDIEFKNGFDCAVRSSNMLEKARCVYPARFKTSMSLEPIANN